MSSFYNISQPIIIEDKWNISKTFLPYHDTLLERGIPSKFRIRLPAATMLALCYAENRLVPIVRTHLAAAPSGNIALAEKHDI